MFGLGLGELLLLAVILFVLIGPKQIPEVMKVVGNIVRELSKARQDLNATIDQDDSLRSIRDSVKDVKSTVQDQVQKIASSIHENLTEEDSAHVTKSEEEKKPNE